MVMNGQSVIMNGQSVVRNGQYRTAFSSVNRHRIFTLHVLS